MIAALLGDVHGNLPALEAVLAHASAHGAEVLWNVGDFIGYGPFPEQVVRRLQEAGAVSIRGNYDVKALRLGDGDPTATPPQNPLKRAAFAWAYAQLSPASREALRGLPDERRLEAAGRRVLLAHASPGETEAALGPDLAPTRWRELAEAAGADLVLVGHSHRPFIHREAGVWFINPGSAGRPEGGDPRACYALLRIEAGLVEVCHYWLEYDVDRWIAEAARQHLPATFAEMARRGRNLDEVLGDGASQASSDETGRLQEIAVVAEGLFPDDGHAGTVAGLSLHLFDQWQPWHGLGPTERFWLHAAALLHDIGWSEGRQAHHQTSLRLICEHPGLPLDKRERQIIGSIARYHRKALPDRKHEHFAALAPAEQAQVSLLAGLLRVADGLDCLHLGRVELLECEVTPAKLIVRGRVRGPAEDERREALAKGDLIEKVSERTLVIEWVGR